MLSLITPTRGRPQAFKLLERWMKRQTFRPLEWIVAIDSDPLEYEFTMGQTVVQGGVGEGSSFLRNLRAGLTRAKKGDFVVFIEDDDWYHPQYLERLVQAMAWDSDLIGFCPAMYYRVSDQLWRCMGNTKHCSLAQTAIQSSKVPLVLDIIDKGRSNVDMQLWTTPGIVQQFLENEAPDGLRYHVGMKGMPGTPGIGIGHKPEFPGRTDPEGRHLRGMIGDDVLAYREFMGDPSRG